MVSVNTAANDFLIEKSFFSDSTVESSSALNLAGSCARCDISPTMKTIRYSPAVPIALAYMYLPQKKKKPYETMPQHDAVANGGDETECWVEIIKIDYYHFGA